jgi:hypothetical protein
MNYLSDDEDNTNVNTEPTLEELYPEEEMDEEMIAIIRKHACKEINNDYSYPIKDKEKTNLEKDNEKTNLKKDKLKKFKTLKEYIKEEEEKQPKKWSSSRADNKKKINDTEKIIKRQFNPRLPPFRTIEKKQEFESKINNLEEQFHNLIT